jgi:hypothetical protein
MLTSGAPVDDPRPEFDSEVSTADDSCDSSLKDIATSLRESTELVCDIAIPKLTLLFGIKADEPPTLLGCDGSEFSASMDLQPYVSSLQIISLLYAAETSVATIPSECITRGRYCLTGSQTMERSKIVSLHIKRIVEMLGFDDEAFRYMRRRMTSLNPSLMMAHVPVCADCFRYYNQDHPGKRCATATERTRLNAAMTLRNSVEKVNRPKTNLRTRKVDPLATASLPIIRARAPEYRIGDITPSGLKVVSQRSTIQLELATRMYKRPPFVRPPPPLPDPEWRYHPPSLEAKN